LERDIDDLQREKGEILEEHKKREKKSKEAIDFWQDKSTNIEKQNRELKAENERLVIKLREKSAIVSSTTKVNYLSRVLHLKLFRRHITIQQILNGIMKITIMGSILYSLLNQRRNYYCY